MQRSSFENQFIESCRKSGKKQSHPFKFAVHIHGTPVRFWVHTDKLCKELSQYFPLAWQKVGGEYAGAVDIYWDAPETVFERPTPFWGEAHSPECFFFESFVFQRDFWAHKASEKHFQLLCNEKISDGFFNFLRYFLPRLLLKKKKILFHASCVVEHTHKALLFFGFSGAGKTTMATFCDGATVLGDDMCVLSISDDQVVVEPALVGQTMQNASTFGKSFPVKAGFWLEQDEEVEFLPLESQSRLKVLSSFSGLFWSQLEPELYETVFSMVDALEKRMDLFTLKFPKRKEVWHDVQEFSKNLLQKQSFSVADYGGRYLNY